MILRGTPALGTDLAARASRPGGPELPERALTGPAGGHLPVRRTSEGCPELATRPQASLRRCAVRRCVGGSKPFFPPSDYRESDRRLGREEDDH